MNFLKDLLACGDQLSVVDKYWRQELHIEFRVGDVGFTAQDHDLALVEIQDRFQLPSQLLLVHLAE